MVRGRNTTVVSLRLPDDVVRGLKVKAQNMGLSLSDYLKQDKLFQRTSPNEDEVSPASREYSSIQNRVVGRNLAKKITVDQVDSQIRNRNGKIIPDQDWEFFKKHPDKNCPCGSKVQYRYCHGVNEKTLI